MNARSMPYDAHALRQLPAIAKAYQLPDHRKATIQILNSLLPFIGIWVAMYLLLEVSVWLTLLLAVVNAFFLVRIFIIQHDCGHQSFTANRRLNDVIGSLCSYLSLIPYRYWAKSHHFHHGHTGMLWEHRDIGDIKTLTVKEFKELPWYKKLRYLAFRNPFVLFFVGPLWYILVNNRLPLIQMKGWTKVHRSLWFNNLWAAAFYVILSLVLGVKALLLIHLPIVFIFGIIAIWFFYIQHQHETTYMQWKNQWDAILAAIKGSTYYKLPKLFHWLTGNIGYHHIHHLNPLIPNYQLARCHHDNPLFEKYANTITFLQSLKCIFHRFWDEEQGKMITLREYWKLYRKSV